MRELYVGIDIGSITVKVVVLDQERTLLATRYVHAHGRPRQTLGRILPVLHSEIDLSDVRMVGFTGSGGGPIAQQVGALHVNELVAQTHAVGEYHPQTRTVIEIGGQDSKLLILDRNPHSDRAVLVDFEMNALCAAGTGSFLDQQAERLGVSIEDEFAELALRAEKPASIAGRCTVFAKSDMIHLQQRGVPLPDILSGLCYALARNFKSVIGRGKRFNPPILFQGGVASNQAVVRAFRDVLGLAADEIVIPKHHKLMAALGAALTLIDARFAPASVGAEADANRTSFDLDALLAALRQPAAEPSTLPPLPPAESTFHWQSVGVNGGKRRPVYVGIDVGSISTNVVLIDGRQPAAGSRRQIIARRYLRTAGRPLDAVRQALGEIGDQVGDQVEVCGVGVTGSGRTLTGEYVGADVVRNEITSQARAAVDIDPTVDTVFEIGGQDSKYIRLEQGVVLDFTMNKACAAGTGSFLEEQADKLEISVENDFGRLALCSKAPACLGERCTVFMESNLVHFQQQGASVEDLTAGLAYSIAQNYLNRVVHGRAVGQNVFFQGGVASNPSVVAAFRQITGAQITVPPHHDVTGAIGAAILAQEAAQKDRTDQEQVVRPRTRFHGFDLRERGYRTSVFECQGCVNHCEITRVRFGADRPLFYGARCERYEDHGSGGTPVGSHPKGASAAAELPNFFEMREKLLLRDYRAPIEESPHARGGPTRVRVGVPRALLFYELFPFWHRFLVELGAEVVLSDPTNPHIVRETQENAPAETCFPVKLMQGHVLDLVKKGVDWLFLPSVVGRQGSDPGQERSIYCPFIQSVPHLVMASLDRARPGPGVLSGLVYQDDLHPDRPSGSRRSLVELVRPLDVSRRQVHRSVQAAREAQRAFQEELYQLGKDALANLDAWPRVAVLVGRPYSTNDPGLSNALPFKLHKLGVVPLPIDCLPLDEVEPSDRWDNMFWQSGQKILAAARFIRDDPRLHAIYVTHFGCGPDSFVLSYFRREMAGQLYLELEMDDHTADAGVNTRCEAFFDSLAMQKR